ncbi:MAG TPA: aldo/keto reductase [Polyangiaceae bacterium]|nr:aldo/keto reductase [Polyangiaceae bacterium]
MHDRRFSPRRELGRTGFVATAVGLGDLADRSVPLEDCVTTLRRGLDAGPNVIDTAPSYEDGYSERIVGAALAGRPRDSVFVIDKVDHFDRPVARQIEDSLGRLGLAYCDLFVFHSVSTPEAWTRLLADGRFDELKACASRGMTRFTGISSHHPEVLRAAIPSGLCDVVLFPVGPFVDARYVEEILPLARQHGVGSVCFKTFGGGKLLGNTAGYGQPLEPRPRGKLSSGGKSAETAEASPVLSVADCVRYTLTCDPDVALLGLSFTNEQDAAFAAAEGFAPYSTDELAEVRERARLAVEGKGPCWWNP